MSVSTNYDQSVQVNGYACKNCPEVDNAKKHIDPAHPASGPYDVNAATDPSRQGTSRGSAVSFGGTLTALNAVQAGAQAASVGAPGARIDLNA